ncbi:MAG TPA: Rrf2 family transcriptional regulator [Methylocella sp.]
MAALKIKLSCIEDDHMRLTYLTDFSLRVLMYAGSMPRRLVTIQEIAGAYGISENHLMKVVHGLAQQGFIETVRGHGGGIRLSRPATEITVGSVIRAVEDDFALVECFRTDNTCRITPVCRLRGALQEALGAYFEVLDNWTLAELVAKPKALLNELAPPEA